MQRGDTITSKNATENVLQIERNEDLGGRTGSAGGRSDCVLRKPIRAQVGKGISAFFGWSQAFPGFRVGRHEDKMGQRVVARRWRFC